jgi:alpha-glucoside transport system permease protein
MTSRFLSRLPLHLIIIFITLIWLIPTFGLLVSSFRPAGEIATTGWWTAFANPEQFTTDLYQEALTRQNMGRPAL